MGCHDAVVALKARGHEVKILTSTYGLKKPEIKRDVHRELVSDFGWKSHVYLGHLIRLFAQEIRNRKAFERLVKAFRPHLLYIWNLNHVSITIPFRAQQMGIPICFYVFDNWLSRWERDPWYSLWKRKAVNPASRITKPLLYYMLKAMGLTPYLGTFDLSHVQFASQYLKNIAYKNNKAVENTMVIHWGIHTDRFPFRKVTRSPRRLLFVGQVVEQKGVHTAVEALKRVLQEYDNRDIRLTIAGGTITPEYKSRIHHLVHTLNIEDRIHFTGFISRETLLDIYQKHDILIFPSIWDEPFGITLLEGMSSGLAVVGTGTGGSAEILEDNINALIFPRGDPIACAERILRLIKNPDFYEKLREKGRRAVEERFLFKGTIDEIEKSLFKALSETF